MIWPGLNRPPPMGSELVSGEPSEAGRGVRCAEGDEGVLRGVDATCKSVSPSTPASSPIKVAEVSVSSGFPHEVQNLPVGETCAPHEPQNMGGGDSITGPRQSATSRGDC